MLRHHVLVLPECILSNAVSGQCNLSLGIIGSVHSLVQHWEAGVQQGRPAEHVRHHILQDVLDEWQLDLAVV